MIRKSFCGAFPTGCLCAAARFSLRRHDVDRTAELGLPSLAGAERSDQKLLLLKQTAANIRNHSLFDTGAHAPVFCMRPPVQMLCTARVNISFAMNGSDPGFAQNHADCRGAQLSLGTEIWSRLRQSLVFQ